MRKCKLCSRNATMFLEASKRVHGHTSLIFETYCDIHVQKVKKSLEEQGYTVKIIPIEDMEI